jgi:hypothetical protein
LGRGHGLRLPFVGAGAPVSFPLSYYLLFSNILMSKFESSIKQIPYSQQAVYAMLSDLGNIEKVRDRIPEDKIRDFRFDRDTIAVTAPPVGELRLRIVERDEPKCIKFATEQSPIPFDLWIQVLPVTDATSKMKLTIKAELNPFIKGMVQGPLKEGVEKIADALAAIRYE